MFSLSIFKYFLYTYYYKNIHVFIICDRYVFFQFIFTLNIIIICMFSSSVTGMFFFPLNIIIISMFSSFVTGMLYLFLFCFIYFVLCSNMALHSIVMHFIRGIYLGIYNGMYACFTSHGTYSLTT